MTSTHPIRLPSHILPSPSPLSRASADASDASDATHPATRRAGSGALRSPLSRLPDDQLQGANAFVSGGSTTVSTVEDGGWTDLGWRMGGWRFPKLAANRC